MPLLLIWAPSSGWVVAANALLGVNPELCWSTTVIMSRGAAAGIIADLAGLAAAIWLVPPSPACLA